MSVTFTTAPRIRQLNDQLRTTFVGGVIVCTDGIQNLEDQQVAAILTAVREFNAFSEYNDPHGEHDVGIFEAAGQRVVFKIDYFDRSIRIHSPDPADPRVTTRVLTIMLADEY